MDDHKKDAPLPPRWVVTVREARRTAATARRHGFLADEYLPPPREKHCAPRPTDALCECCGEPTKRFYLDHCHETGAFRGWVCNPCNTGAGLADSVERLEKRIAFLKNAKRIALIKAVHLKVVTNNN
jgi:hypothetical protein